MRRTPRRTALPTGLHVAAIALLLISCTDAPREPQVDRALSVAASGPRLRALSDAPTCPSCEIQLDSFAVIGTSVDTVFPMGGAMIVQGADQAFYVAPMSEQLKVGRYGWTGQLELLLGGRGEAPGKYYSPAGMAASPDSQLLVVSEGRVVWYDMGSLNAVTLPLAVTLNQPSVVAMRGRRFVATTTGGVGMLGQLFYSEPGPSGTPIGRSTSPITATKESVGGIEMFRSLTASDTLTVLTTRRFLEPILEVWSVGAGRVREIELPAPWYPKYDLNALTPAAAGASQVELVPMTFHVWKDAEGLVWTLTSVPDDQRSKEVEPSNPNGSRSEGVRSTSRPLRDQGDGVVAVYAVSDTAVHLVASARFDALLTFFLSDSVVAERSYPDQGSTRFILHKLRLNRGQLK